MKNNSNSVNVNLNRVMVIDRLKSKLNLLQAELEHTKKLEKQYETDMIDYREAVIAAVVEAVADGATIDAVESYTDTTYIRVKVNTRHIVEPRNPRYTHKSVKEIQQDIQSVESNINLLEMCSDETIKSKSYGNILSFLS